MNGQKAVVLRSSQIVTARSIIRDSRLVCWVEESANAELFRGFQELISHPCKANLKYSSRWEEVQSELGLHTEKDRQFIAELVIQWEG